MVERAELFGGGGALHEWVAEVQARVARLAEAALQALGSDPSGPAAERLEVMGALVEHHAAGQLQGGIVEKTWGGAERSVEPFLACEAAWSELRRAYHLVALAAIRAHGAAELEQVLRYLRDVDDINREFPAPSGLVAQIVEVPELAGVCRRIDVDRGHASRPSVEPLS